MGNIQIGYFNDFGEDPEVLLIDADLAGLEAMVELAAKLSRGEPASLNAVIRLANCPSVNFEAAESNLGVAKSDAGWTCRWSRSDWATIADELRAMQDRSPSHQYLGSSTEGPTVIVSNWRIWSFVLEERRLARPLYN